MPRGGLIEEAVKSLGIASVVASLLFGASGVAIAAFPASASHSGADADMMHFKRLPLSVGRVLPGTGGQIVAIHPEGLIKFPPQAVTTPLTVTLASVSQPDDPIAAEIIPLGFFRLSAEDDSGHIHASFARAWTAQFAFGSCHAADVCLWDIVDETSIRCVIFDTTSGEWQPVDSLSEIVARQVHCASNRAGIFAIVGELYETSGAGGGRSLFLPAILH